MRSRSTRRLATAAGIVAALASSAGASGSSTVASLKLSAHYDAIAVVGGRVIISGDPNRSPIVPGSFAGPPGTQRCRSAVVDPTTLTLTDQRTGDCDDPGLYGRRTLVINDFVNGNPNGSHVRVAHLTPTGFALGPVVMTYSELSDTDAEWVYGDGFLWLFDPLTTRGSELLRISQTTGAVLQTIPMPRVDRPLLAADADGLWLAPAVNSGFDPASASGLYRVAPGMTRAVRVLSFKWTVNWLLAAGHSVWIELNHFGKGAALWRLDGTKAAFHVPASFVDNDVGYGQPHFAGDATAGIWSVATGQHRQRVVRIDASTGATATIATINPPRLPADNLNTPVVLLGHSFLFLDAQPQGPEALFRVSF